MKIPQFASYKKEGRPISMVTAYDYQTARLASQSSVDTVLVGDSVAMVCHGYDSTIHATMEMMESHTAAVRRGVGDKLLIADLPFASYRKSLAHTVECCERLLRAGAEAVKLEGEPGNIQTIRHLIESGIPVMGHLGLTPQFLHAFGGHKVQARTDEAAQKLLEQAKNLDTAGCFAMVLECIPSGLAETVTRTVSCSTVGIGAGPHCDGQVLVFYDLLGFQEDFHPRFVRRYAESEKTFVHALDQFHDDIQKRNFPNDREAF